MFAVDLAAAHPLLTIAAIIVVAYVLGSIRIANQYERAVVFRLGKFKHTAGPGLYFVLAGP
jgi:regulator of protease activity HflC (stomatin/prohibitin superfamily)